jgi:hypothetical protein
LLSNEKYGKLIETIFKIIAGNKKKIAKTV